MLLFNSIFIILALSSVLKKRYKQIIYLLMVLIFWVLSFIRWEVGTDWENYLTTFYFSKDLKNIVSVNEYGYRLLNHIIYQITDNYTIFLLVVATLIFLFKYRYLFDVTYEPILSLISVFGTGFGDIYFVRQSLAIAITFYSIKYILEKNFYKFLFLIILSSTIHQASIIFIFAYYIVNYLNFSIKKYIIVLFLCVLISPYVRDILEIFGNILPGIYGEKIRIYLLSDGNLFGFRKGTDRCIIFGLLYLNKFFLIIVGLIFYKKMNKRIKKLFSLYFISACIYLILAQVSLTLARLGVYYDSVQIIVFPAIYKFIKNRRNKFFYLVAFIFYYYIKLLSSINGYKEEYIPYRTFLSK